MRTPLLDRLAAVLGPANLLPADELDSYSVDGLRPEAAVAPENREAVARIMEWAGASNTAVLPRGGGTQTALGNIPSRFNLALDLRQCNRVLDFQPDDLTVTVEAGISLAELQRALAQGGKFLPVEAPLSKRATVGGILATNATGPKRFSYGLPRDWLIGIGVVAAGGVQTKAGGRVVKNVTGYDLNKLYTGSLGTLGVIVEASFKLSPAPLHSQALIALFKSDQPDFSPTAQALTASQDLLKQSYSPQGLQVVNAPAAGRTAVPQVQQMLRASGGNQTLAVAFYEGRDEALVQQRVNDGSRLLREQGADDLVTLDTSHTEALLTEITDMGWALETTPVLAVKLNVPPTAVATTSIAAGEQPLKLRRPNLTRLSRT